MSTFKAKIATVAAIAAAAGSALLMVAGAASAAPTTPSSAITNDPNAKGSVSFYDTTGNQVTSGSNLKHLFDYALSSSAGRAGTTKATLYFAFPDHTQSDSNNWYTFQSSKGTTFPNPSAPTPPNPSTNPLVTLGSADANLSDAASTAVLDHTSGYDGIVQVRVYDTGPGIGQDTVFWATDIYYDATAGTWVQVYPAPPAKTATAVATPTATPASPAPSGTTSVNLTSTVTASDNSHPAGTVELFNGSADLGPATFTASTGAVSATATVADGGTYSFTFKFTPTGNAYSGSTSPALAYRVKGAAVGTNTTLTGPATANTGDTVTYTAAVTQGSTALGSSDGKVQFAVNGSSVGAPVALDANGKASLNYTPTAAGTYNVTASFTPTDPTTYNASASNTVTTTVAAAAYNPDPQTVTVTVPKGTLVISTPYTPANPFKLGTMTLNSSGTLYTASANFGDPNSPASTDPTSTSAGVEITDTRGGTNTGWTASAQTTDFVGPNSATINGDNLTFTNVKPKYFTGNNLQTGDVTTNDIAAFKTTKKSFATSAKGPGSVNITGVLGLTAPTSTQPGDYTATVTFTIA